MMNIKEDHQNGWATKQKLVDNQSHLLLEN
jgi:hypothetical protein